MKEEYILLLSDLYKLINRVVLINYIIILGGDWMIESIAKVFESFGRRMGIEIKLPVPSDHTISVTNIFNTLIGGGIILLGYISRKSWLGVIGMIAVFLNMIFMIFKKNR